MRPNKHEPGRVSRETGGQRSPQHPFTSSKGGTEPLALLVHLADVNAIHSPDATRNGLAHASEHFQRSVTAVELGIAKSVKVLLVLAVGVNVTQFCLKFGVDSFSERMFLGLGNQGQEFVAHVRCFFRLIGVRGCNVVVTSLGVKVEQQSHWEGLAKLEHAALLVLVLHPHHCFHRQVANGVVNVPPENPALFVTTITGVEAETSKETNGSCSSSESRDGHG
mmetsp:Transcript_13481/g.22330  ORF Transcript_13481/g.22330 Transcript_13481/m.22330 type:complete len:222 (+) Transcript_13481:524-1189(+)